MCAYVVKCQLIRGLREMGKLHVESPQSSITRQKGCKMGSVELWGNWHELIFFSRNADLYNKAETQLTLYFRDSAIIWKEWK